MIRFFLTILLTIAFSNIEIFASNNPILLTQEAISQRQLDLPKNKDLKETFGNEHPLTLVSIKNLPSDDKVVFTYTRNLFKELNLPTVQTKQFSMKDFLKSVEISKNGLPFHVVQGLGYIPGEEIECFVEAAGFKSNVITITPFPIRSESKVDRACATATIKSLGSGGIYRLSFDNF